MYNECMFVWRGMHRQIVYIAYIYVYYATRHQFSVPHAEEINWQLKTSYLDGEGGHRKQNGA